MSTLIILKEGTRVGRWEIQQLIGKGTFGAVYLCTDISEPAEEKDQYALKTESLEAQLQVLQMEVLVLTELEKYDFRHFCQIFDRGTRPTMNYVVMTLVGPSLHDLRKRRRPERFTMGTAIGASIQMLEALRDLHSIGYLHRDVKPTNFTIGTKEAIKLIYLVDFGLARKFINEKNEIRLPRTAAAFRGTPRYASISTHLGRELCRKDDLESLMYTCVELTTAALPWRRISDVKEIGICKERAQQADGMAALFEGCPPEYAKVMQIIRALNYYDSPDYELMNRLLQNSFKTMRTKEFPYDWE